MANNKLELNPEVLDIEYQMLMEELDSLNSLYDEAKDRLDAVAKYPTKANPVFMASQTANLISIKEKRLNIIKELINIKKAKSELKAKEFNANNKLEEIESGASREILELYRLLNKNDKSILLQTSIEDEDNTVEEIETDEDFEEIYKNAVDEEFSNNKKKTQKIPDGYKVVCDEDKNLYIVDNDYNLIEEDIGVNLDLIKIVKFKEVDEETFGYDENGNAYEVVEV